MFRLVVSLAFVALVSGGALDVPERWLPDAYIVGGSEAADGQFPYQVSLRRQGTSSHFCGGSVISADWVLTAAHCTVDMTPSGMFVVAGTNSLSSGGVTVRVFHIFVHENYDPNKVTNDVSVILLNTPLTLSSTIAPIALTTVDTEGGTEAIVSGWGRLSNSGAIPDRLQFLERRIVETARCQTLIGTNDDNICTNGQIGHGLCFGDSGGPLVTSTGQVGICSYIVISCAAGFPDAYSKVYSHREWIRDQTGV